ncbi:MAG: thioredoxin family protein [Acidobacteriota bacterium]|nr:thioredoxin family protein [Blastocatellia bacterium]MDW8168670.1 thioredoxin family protein [Acidobacteriota bacterium]MDW8255833.1 thioredoxin family protein [Acidobacteriota bacterium]
MKHRVLAWGMAIVLPLVVWAQNTPKLKPGDTIPASVKDVKMLSVTGRQLSIADVKGPKGTLVIFSCNSCPWVKAWETRIAEVGNWAQKQGIGVIMINPNDPAKNPEDSYEVMQQRTKERGFEFPYVVDATSDVARAFGATHTPEFFLFDATGKLVYTGALDDNARNPEAVKERYLQNAIEALLAGKPIPVAQTRSIGCTIKFREKI